MDSPIEGMESVVATVSGYHGSERFKLIKLISNAGASYVGAMGKSTTHLVCWKFEGKKYDLARKFKTVVIVNHRWIEDCIKQGKRVLEHPYGLQSGQEIGPLVLEIPPVRNLKSDNKTHRPSFEKSNMSDELERRISDVTYGDPDVGGCTSSFLLNENFHLLCEDLGDKIHFLLAILPQNSSYDGIKRKGAANKSKRKQSRKFSKQKKWSFSRDCFQEFPLSGFVEVQHGDSSSDSSMNTLREKRTISRPEKSSSHSKMCPGRAKRKISEDIGSSFLGTLRKGRRLAKKNVSEDNFETIILDSDEEYCPIDLQNNNTSAPSQITDGKRTVELLGSGGTSHVALENHRNLMNEGFDEMKETIDGNSTASDNPNSCPEDGLPSLYRPDACTGSGSISGSIQYVDQLEPDTRPSSMALSCVICWTEFSSTRGILPCGHRFCYSCIQQWADHMASMRKLCACPLCKASFVSITKVEDAATSDQKIYSQTIPCASSATDIIIFADQERNRIDNESVLAPVCSECRCREPEDLLIVCHVCQIRCIHSYCLDPPISPWSCIHCKELQMLYHQSR